MSCERKDTVAGNGGGNGRGRRCEQERLRASPARWPHPSTARRARTCGATGWRADCLIVIDCDRPRFSPDRPSARKRRSIRTSTSAFRSPGAPAWRLDAVDDRRRARRHGRAAARRPSPTIWCATLPRPGARARTHRDHVRYDGLLAIGSDGLLGLSKTAARRRSRARRAGRCDHAAPGYAATGRFHPRLHERSLQPLGMPDRPPAPAAEFRLTAHPPV